MAEAEGVIKYRLDYAAGPAPAADDAFARLRAWRDVLHRLALVGQTPERYAGYGYGNVSARNAAGFVISGTQTGGPARLEADGYAQVTACDVARNAITATGPVKPSSEALTHGAVYALSPDISCVLHVHSPDIWTAAPALGLPATAADVPYGTPAMAAAVATLYATTDLPRVGVFTMRGHEDGVVAFGADADDAGRRLVTVLADALAA